MRRAVLLLLVGVTLVASLPTPEGPRNQADLLQLILDSRPEDNDLVSGGEKTEPEEDVPSGQDQISAAPSVQVQEPTVVQLSEQESTNDAEQLDQLQSNGNPQKEDSDTNKEDGQEQEPKVEQRKTEPETGEIKEQSELEVKQANEPNPEPETEEIKEQSEPEVKQADEPNPEPEEEISKQVPENEQENIQPQAEVEQVPQEGDLIQLPAAMEDEKDTGIIVVDQEYTGIEPSFVDELHPVVVDFPEDGELHEVSRPQEYSLKEMTEKDFVRWLFPNFNYGENMEPQVHVSEEFPSLGPYSVLDVIREPDDNSQEMSVINDASERQDDSPPGIFTEEGIENPEFDNADIIPEDPVLVNGEDAVVLKENIPMDETYPVPLATDFTHPTELEDPADDVSLVDFFIPSHETPLYEGTGDETPFGMVYGEEFFQDEAPEEEFRQDEAPEEEFFHDEAPEEEFSQDEVPEEEILYDEVPVEEFFHDEAPEEELFHDETPEEVFFPEEAPEEEIFHDASEVEFFHDEAPEEEFFHDEAPEEEYFHDEIVPQMGEEEMPYELGSSMSAEGVVLPEEVSEDEVYIPEGVVPQTNLQVSDEDPTDETNIVVIVPEPDYVAPEEDGPASKVVLSDFVPDSAPIMREQQPLRLELPLEANSELSRSPTLLEALMSGFPIEEYSEFRDSGFPLRIMEDGPRPVPDMGEPFIMIEREETSSNSDSDVDIYVMDVPQQDSEDTNAAMLPLAGEPVIIEEQPVPIAEYLEQPVPIAEYPEENYHEPIIEDQPYRIPDNDDDDRIIFPNDEPHRSLPIFPHQWDENSHFIPREEEQTTGDDSLHLLSVSGETQTGVLHPMSDDYMPPPFPVQPEIPQDVTDSMNSGFPQVPIDSIVPFFEPHHERDDTASEIYIGSTMFRKPFQVPSFSQQNLNYYNTVRRQSSAFPHHIHRPINFPEHFHGPSSFPQHFHGPVSHPHPFSGPEMFSDYDGPLLPQNRDTEDFHPHPLTGPEPIMHQEPFYGPSGEPPMKESSLSPLFRTSSMPVSFERLNQREPQLDIEIYPVEVTFTPNDDSFAVSSYSSSPNRYPAYNFLHRPYFNTRHSSSYGDPVYTGPPMYPNTGLYPPTPTHSRYASNLDPSYPYPTPAW